MSEDNQQVRCNGPLAAILDDVERRAEARGRAAERAWFVEWLTRIEKVATNEKGRAIVQQLRWSLENGFDDVDRAAAEEESGAHREGGERG